MAITFELQSDVSNHTVNDVGKIVRNHTRTLLAKSDSAVFVSSYDVAVATGLVPGDVHPSDEYATIRKINPVRRKTIPPNQAWDVTVEWSTETTEVDIEENPVNRRVKRSESTTDQQRYIIRDKNGKLILTSAKRPFDGGVPTTVKLGTITFERNEQHGAGYYVGKAITLSGKLNSLPFMGADAETLMLNVDAKETWEGIWHYWAVTYSFVHEPLGWQPRPINADFYELISGEHVRIRENGNDATEPVPLDSSGRVIPIASRPDACIFVEVEWFDTFDFNSLGLPLS